MKVCKYKKRIYELERENKILKNMNMEYKKEIERLNRSLNGVIKAGRTLTL